MHVDCEASALDVLLLFGWSFYVAREAKITNSPKVLGFTNIICSIAAIPYTQRISRNMEGDAERQKVALVIFQSVASFTVAIVVAISYI